MTKTLLVTGSSGLVGSECVRHFVRLGWRVHGIDNNMRGEWFGKDGDTTVSRLRLIAEVRGFTPHDIDIRDTGLVSNLMGKHKPDMIIHAAGQPSHDFAAGRPWEDFYVNACGTLDMLEIMRCRAPDAAFCFLSTNKVYGDAPNELPLVEGETRWDYVEPADWQGVNESMRIDRTTHSLFGVSKLSADLMVQEYGRYFGLKTVCFRAGCLTGSAHAAAEQHGFLAYLARCIREGRPYTVHGYKGKQVRDNLHAVDVARACEEYHKAPRPGEVYNLGGGRTNSVSILEAIGEMETVTGKKLAWSYSEQARKGDHICYISDTSKLQLHYPGWNVSRGLGSIIDELCACPRT